MSKWFTKSDFESLHTGLYRDSDGDLRLHYNAIIVDENNVFNYMFDSFGYEHQYESPDAKPVKEHLYGLIPGKKGLVFSFGAAVIQRDTATRPADLSGETDCFIEQEGSVERAYFVGIHIPFNALHDPEPYVEVDF